MIRLRTKCFHYSDPQHGWKLQQFVPLRLTVPFNFKHKSVYRTFEKRTFIYKESKLVTCRRPTYRPRWTWTRWAAWWWSPWWWSCRSHRSSRTCSNQKLIFASTGAGAVEADRGGEARAVGAGAVVASSQPERTITDKITKT